MKGINILFSLIIFNMFNIKMINAYIIEFNFAMKRKIMINLVLITNKNKIYHYFSS